MMTDANIQELIMIVKSIQLNDSKTNNTYSSEGFVVRRCLNFCNDHDINITHGSAYKELRHKSYYYINKCIDSIIDKGIDLYGLRENHIISDKEIVDKLLGVKN